MPEQLKNPSGCRILDEKIVHVLSFNDKASKFYAYMEDANHKLYPSTKLPNVVHCTLAVHQMSQKVIDKTFDVLLKFLRVS